jgi:hypothetical protein
MKVLPAPCLSNGQEDESFYEASKHRSETLGIATLCAMCCLFHITCCGLATAECLDTRVSGLSSPLTCRMLRCGHMCFPTLEIRATMEGVMGGALFRRLRIEQGARSPQSAHVIRQELRYLQYLPKLVDHGQYAWLDHYLASWLPYGPN